MSEVTIDVAKESSIQQIYGLIKEGSGLHIVPTKDTLTEGTLYQNGTVNGTNVSCVNCDGKIYFVADNSKTLYLYNPTTYAYHKECELPYYVDNHETVMISFHNEIHLLGGRDDKSRTHYKYVDGEWRIASTLPYDFCAGKAIVFNDELHIIGGGTNYYSNPYYDEDKFINNHYKWDGETWSKASDLPYITRSSCVFVNESKLHVIGGVKIDENTDNSKNHYVWDGLSWSTSVSLPIGMQNCSAVSVSDTEVYIAGGNEPNTNNKLTSVYLWNGISFTNLGVTLENDALNDSGNCMACDEDDIPMIIGKRFYRIVNGKVEVKYSFGDFDNGTSVIYNNEIHVFYNNDHFMFSGKTKGEWVKLEDNIHNCTGASAVVCDDGIHLLGSESSPCADYHCVWSPDNGWRVLSNLPTKFTDGTAVFYNGRIHIIGGDELNNSTYNHYMLRDAKWVAVGRTPHNVSGTKSVCVLGDNLYAVGYDDETYKKYLMKFDGNGWSTVTSWEATSTDSESSLYNVEVGPSICLVYKNRLYTIDYELNTGKIKTKLFLTGNSDLVSNKFIQYKDIQCNIGTNIHCIPNALVYNGYIYIIKQQSASFGNVAQVSLLVEDIPVIKVWIPENHKIICDKSKFLPIIGYMEETNDGYIALSTGLYTIYVDSYDEPYTVC